MAALTEALGNLPAIQWLDIDSSDRSTRSPPTPQWQDNDRSERSPSNFHLQDNDSSDRSTRKPTSYSMARQ